jgi:hypothetical protein
MNAALHLADAPAQRTEEKPPERWLIDVKAAAVLLSISPRSAKRLASDHPELTVAIGRRRLFSRAKLEAWISAGCPGPRPSRRP